MVNVNRVFLAGNMTRDPQLKIISGGQEVVDFCIAINRKYRNKAGELKKETCFVDCAVFGDKARTINNNFEKGRPILVEGRLKFDTWETPAGQKRSKLRVVADNFCFVDPKKDAEISNQNEVDEETMDEQFDTVIDD